MDSLNVKPPAWFWAVAVLALLWNLMGASAYLTQAFLSADAVANMPAAERTLLESQPAWVTAAFAIAVWGGLLASIFLLARKKWATTLFGISLLGVLAQQTYLFFLSNAMEVYGPAGLIMPVSVFLVAVALLLFSRSAEARQWLG